MHYFPLGIEDDIIMPKTHTQTVTHTHTHTHTHKYIEHILVEEVRKEQEKH